MFKFSWSEIGEMDSRTLNFWASGLGYISETINNASNMGVL